LRISKRSTYPGNGLFSHKQPPLFFSASQTLADGKRLNVSPKQLIELLKSYGFVYRKTEGDHEIYKRPGYRPFPIPIKQNPVWIRIVKNALQIIAEIREMQE
jgi:predicted RNA binding protein YcfA (HicA-like mRNA interferase family)